MDLTHVEEVGLLQYLPGFRLERKRKGGMWERGRGRNKNEVCKQAGCVSATMTVPGWKLVGD